MGEQTCDITKISVEDFGDDLDDGKLKEIFENYGKVVSAKVMRDQDTASGRKNRGFGFICFEDSKCAEKAIEELKDINIKKVLYVRGIVQKKVIGRVTIHPSTGTQGTTSLVTRMGPTDIHNRQFSAMSRSFVRAQRSLQPNIQKQGQDLITPAMLTEANPQEQKQMLGNRLYPLIHRWYPELAGKLTGMLLELDNSELMYMIWHPEDLKDKVAEAIAVLQAHNAKLNK